MGTGRFWNVVTKEERVAVPFVEVQVFFLLIQTESHNKSFFISRHLHGLERHIFNGFVAFRSWRWFIRHP